MDNIIRDIRYALRGIRRAPLLTCVIVLALTAGIGLNAGVFTIVEGVWFRAPVDKDPDSFVQLIPQYSGWFPSADQYEAFTANDFDALRAQSRSLTDIAAWSGGGAAGDIRLDDDPTLAGLGLVTCNFFDAYGLGRPQLGRLFLPQECSTPGSAPVAVLSESLWRSRYATDPHVVGRIIRINQHPYTVVGVIRADSTGWMRNVLFIPYTMQPQLYRGNDAFKNSNWPWLTVVGRLKPDYSRAEARAELSVTENQQDKFITGRRTKLVLTNGLLFEDPSLHSFGLVITPLIIGPVVLVLFVACMNVATLFLSRAAARRGEVAVRLALGAGRISLLRTLAAEGLIAAVLAGAISVYLAYQIPKAFWKFAIPIGGFGARNPDWVVFSYLAGSVLITVCIAALAPARQSLKMDLVTALKGQEVLTASCSRVQGILVGAQIAMSFVLIAVGVLFVRDQLSITATDPGFETRHVMMVPLSVPMPPYTPDSAATFHRAIEQRVRELPGVKSVSYASTAPFAEPKLVEIRLPGQRRGQGRQASVDAVSTSFLETLGIPIIRGRDFQHSDAGADGNTGVAIVTEAFVKAFWNGQDPLGKVVVMPDGERLLIVGVARDIRSHGYGALDGPKIYVPQGPQSFAGPLLVRFEGDARSLAPAIQKIVRNLDTTQIVVPQSLRSILEDEAETIRSVTDVILFIAFLAVALALTGVYGIVAFSTGQRTREFGIRMALGATRGRIARSVLVRGARQIVIGLSFGLTLALPTGWAWARILKGSSFQPTAHDFVIIFVLAAALLTLTALAACYIPARRAMRVDPMVALRYE
jgi:predicted permease